MKKTLIVSVFILSFIAGQNAIAGGYTSIKNTDETRISLSASVGLPFNTGSMIIADNKPAMGYSVLWNGGSYFVAGMGMEFNNKFEYQNDTINKVVTLHVAQIMLGLSIPESWNEYVSGPVMGMMFGVGFKSGNIYPHAPLKWGVWLQQNLNLPGDLDGLKLGFFLRGTLCTFVYSELAEGQSTTNMKNNYQGFGEFGVRLYLINK